MKQLTSNLRKQREFEEQSLEGKINSKLQMLGRPPKYYQPQISQILNAQSVEKPAAVSQYMTNVQRLNQSPNSLLNFYSNSNNSPDKNRSPI